MEAHSSMADVDGLSSVKSESIYGAAVNDYDLLKKTSRTKCPTCFFNEAKR